MYVTYVCLFFFFCSVDKRVVQIKKYSGLKFVNMRGWCYKRRPSDMRCVHFNFIWLKLIKIRVMLETFGRIWHNVFVFHWCGVWYMDPSITNRTWCVMFVLCLCFFFFFSIALFVVVICKLVDTITVILISYVFRPMHKMFKYVLHLLR